MKIMLSRIFGVILILTLLAGIPVDIVAADGVQIVFTTSPQTIKAGSLSGFFTIQTKDDLDHLYNVTANTIIDLMSSSPTGRFYSDSSGLISTTQITINAGDNSARFYYRDTTSGSPTITAAESSSQGWTPATQIQTVNYAELDHFSFSDIDNQTENISFSITITAQDVYNNTVASYTGSNTLSIAEGTITPTTTGAFIEGVWTGDITITSIQNGITITSSNGEKIGTSNSFDVVVNNNMKIIFTTTPQTITAGDVSEIFTIQIQDDINNPKNMITDTIFCLTSNSVDGIFYSDAEGLNPVTQVTILEGENSVNFYYKDTTSGSPTIAVAESPSQGWASATQIQNINAANLDHFSFANISNQTENSSFYITIIAQDIFNNTVNSYTGSNTLSIAEGTITPATTGAFTDGVWSGNVTITSPQNDTTIITSGEDKIGASNIFNVIATVLPNNIKLVFITAPYTIETDVISGMITIQTQDDLSNPYNLETETIINISSSSTTGVFYSDATGSIPITLITIFAGENSASFYYKDTASGSPTIAAAESPSQGWTSATQGVIITPAAPVEDSTSESKIPLALIIIVVCVIFVLVIGYFVFSHIKKSGNQKKEELSAETQEISSEAHQITEVLNTVEQDASPTLTPESAPNDEVVEQDASPTLTPESAPNDEVVEQEVTQNAIPEPVIKANEKERTLLTDLLDEIENNYNVAVSPATTTLVAFQSKVWDSNKNKINFLQANAKEELSKAYMAMSLANGIVWLANDQGRRSSNLDENYIKLCKNIIEQLDNVKHTLEQSNINAKH